MFVEDIAAFLATEEFATLATIGAATVPGIFDNAYQDVLSIVPGSQMIFLCATAKVASVVVGDSVTIDSTAYRIAEIQPDGTGMTRLLLK